MKNLKKYAGNIIFVGLMLLFLFNTDAKSWVLKQLISVGLFKAELKQDSLLKSALATSVSFSYTDENANKISNYDLKGKVVFINFWASWCPPCRAEMSSINNLYKALKNDSRFVFVFINEDEDKTKALQFLQKNKYDIPLQSRAGNISNEIFSGSLPTTVVLNKEGKIVLKKEGIAGYNNQDFINQLKSLL